MSQMSADLGDNVSRALDFMEERTKKGATHFRDEVKSFCLQTSIKGVPRVIKTKNYFLRAVWAIGVCALLGMCQNFYS